jgi:mannose-6-phosphate isomerase
MTDPLPSPLFLRPFLRPLVWGGTRLAYVFGKGTADAPIAEAWELADREEGSSVVVGGPLDGASLTEVTRERGEALLGPAGVRASWNGRFPVLFKLIDAADRLSVQVHPGREDLPRLPGGTEPKDEAWLILDAAPGSVIYRGLRDGLGLPALEQALALGQVEHALHSFAPARGDVVHLPPGTLHAIGAGVLLAEVQQNSDTTYRVWDWGRPGTDGKMRPLHVPEALAVTRFGQPPLPDRVRSARDGLPPQDALLASGDGFQMSWVHVRPRHPRVIDADPERFQAFCLLEGTARVAWEDDGQAAGRALAMGETFLQAATGRPFTLVTAGGAGLLRVRVP